MLINIICVYAVYQLLQGQIQTGSRGSSEQVFSSNRDEIFRTVLFKAPSHHIPTGRHRLDKEPVPAEILDVMNRRDDLHKRDSLTAHDRAYHSTL